VLGFAIAGPVQSQDKDKGKAKDRAPVTKVLLENDKVRVAETTFKPGDVSRNQRKARVSYTVKGGKLERTSADGKKLVNERKAGTAVWLEADSDVVTNVGKTTVTVITTQLK
jgi:hypothetical protein